MARRKTGEKLPPAEQEPVPVQLPPEGQPDLKPPPQPPASSAPGNDAAGPVEEPREEGDRGPYDPLSKRMNAGQSSLGGFMHLFKSAVGAGILSMPSAFRKGGLWFSLVATICMGAVCAYCSYILVDCSRKQCVMSRVPALKYGATGEHAFLNGPARFRKHSNRFKHLVNWSLYFCYFGLSSVYVVFVGTQFKQLIECYTDWNFGPYHISLYLFTLFPFFLVLGQIRTLHSLVPVSAMANVMFLGVVGLVLYLILRTPMPHLSDREAVGHWTEIPMFFSIALFAFENVGVVLPVENDLKRPQDMLGCGILINSMICTVTLYSIIGLLGFWKYGHDVKDSITLNTEKGHWASLTIKIVITLGMYFSYGIAAYVPTHILWDGILERVKPQTLVRLHSHFLPEVLFRTAMTLMTVVVAAAVPRITSIMGIIGAIFFSIVGLLCPVVIHLVTNWENPKRNIITVVIDFSIIVVFFWIVATGTYAAIIELIHFNPRASDCY